MNWRRNVLVLLGLSGVVTNLGSECQSLLQDACITEFWCNFKQSPMFKVDISLNELNNFYAEITWSIHYKYNISKIYINRDCVEEHFNYWSLLVHLAIFSKTQLHLTWYKRSLSETLIELSQWIIPNAQRTSFLKKKKKVMRALLVNEITSSNSFDS